jgi:lipid-A-disaccharide synthase
MQNKKQDSTHYYISPQIWASRENRSLTSKKIDHKCMLFYPLKHFMKKNNFPVEFVGHPLIDAIHNHP